MPHEGDGAEVGETGAEPGNEAVNRFTDASNGLWQGHLSVERNASNKRKPDVQNISRRTKTMTDLIYRGIAHTGTKATPARTAQALTYRGVAHDGIAAQPARTARTIELCYRGVRHGARTAAPVQPAHGAFARLLAA